MISDDDFQAYCRNYIEFKNLIILIIAYYYVFISKIITYSNFSAKIVGQFY